MARKGVKREKDREGRNERQKRSNEGRAKGRENEAK